MRSARMKIVPLVRRRRRRARGRRAGRRGAGRRRQRRRLREHRRNELRRGFQSRFRQRRIGVGRRCADCAMAARGANRARSANAMGVSRSDHPRSRGAWNLQLHMPMVKSAILVHRVGNSRGSLAAGRFRARTRCPRVSTRRFRLASTLPQGVRPMSAAPGADDARFQSLSEWTKRTLRTDAFALAPASADASFRRYFRVTPEAAWRGHATLIVMDAPPPKEDCRPFVHVAGLLKDAGLNAPEVLAADHGARLPAPHRPRHPDLPRGARCRVGAGALRRRDRGARPLAAGHARRRTAAVRRSPARARARALSRLVCREASRDRAHARRRSRRWPRRSAGSSTTISRSRACSSTATTIRAT